MLFYVLLMLDFSLFFVLYKNNKGFEYWEEIIKCWSKISYFLFKCFLKKKMEKLIEDVGILKFLVKWIVVEVIGIVFIRICD